MISERVGQAILEFVTDASGFKKTLADIQKDTEGLKGMVSGVGKAIGAAFTVGAIVSAGKAVLDFAGNITDLSQKTGISASGLQKLDLAFKASGIAIDQVAKASGELGTRLVSNKGAVELVKQLGLNLDELKRSSPEDQFITVADAVGQIQNKGEQLYASKTLFGKSGEDLLKGLTGNLKETTDELENMGLIIEDETIKAADDFGDQLGLMGTQLMAITAEIVGPLLPALSALATLLMQVGSVVGDVTGFFVGWIQKGLVAAYSAIATFLAWVAEAATKIPILGKHLGFASEAAEYLRQSAANADEYLVSLFTTTDKVKESAVNAAGPLIGLGDASEDSARRAKDAAKELQKQVEENGKQSQRMIEADRKALEMFQQSAEEAVRLKLDTADSYAKAYLEIELQRHEEELKLEQNYALLMSEIRNAEGLAQMEAARKEYELQKAKVDTWNETASEIGVILTEMGSRMQSYMGDVIATSGMAVTGFMDYLKKSGEEGTRTAIGTATALMDGVGAVFGQLGKKHKAFAIAGAIIDTVSAIVKTLAAYPFPWSLIPAAAVGAMGYMHVREIQNAETPGYEKGTPGLDFMEFGKGTLAVLHKREAVVPEDRLDDFAARHGFVPRGMPSLGPSVVGAVVDMQGTLEKGLARLYREQRDLPFRLTQSFKAAQAMA